MFVYIRKQDFKAKPYEDIIDRLESEKVDLQMLISTCVTAAEGYRLDALSWQAKACQWESEAKRYKNALDRAAAQRIADVLEKRYTIDLN